MHKVTLCTALHPQRLRNTRQSTEDLGASSALIPEADLGREIEKMAEALLQLGVAVNAAADVADDVAQAAQARPGKARTLSSYRNSGTHTWGPREGGRPPHPSKATKDCGPN